MKPLKIIGLILVSLTLFSCSNTADKYQMSNFEQMEVKPLNGNTIKKSFHSDHHLMMSLLNRPITADQALMLAFVKPALSLNKATAFVNFISIKGDGSLEIKSNNRKSQYLGLIVKDNNSVSINGSF
jgi:hypothetical protein